MKTKSSFLWLLLAVLMAGSSCKKEIPKAVLNAQPKEPVALLTGDWNVKERCTQSGVFEYQVNIKQVDSLPNGILIKNLYEIDQYIACILLGGDSCKLDNTAQINGFPVGGVMKWGQDDSLRLQYVIRSTVPETCTMVMGR